MSQCPACHSSQYKEISYLDGMQCSDCQTIYIQSRKNFVYDDSYPVNRDHNQTHVEQCKAQTTMNWLNDNKFNLVDKNVFEFGFGQATSLEVFKNSGALVEGCEIVYQNRVSAIKKGFKTDGIYKDLDQIKGKTYDYLFFFDSFEHITTPEKEMEKITKISKLGSKAMVVLPSSSSFSLPILRKFWPHNIPDHWVFYSKEGLEILWHRFGWEVESFFYPGKVVSLKTIVKHIGMFFPGFNFLASFTPEIKLHFNIGEVGVVFKKKN